MLDHATTYWMLDEGSMMQTKAITQMQDRDSTGLMLKHSTTIEILVLIPNDSGPNLMSFLLGEVYQNKQIKIGKLIKTGDKLQRSKKMYNMQEWFNTFPF
jgi:hypothetical protein